jgi:hypothetical protein
MAEWPTEKDNEINPGEHFIVFFDESNLPDKVLGINAFEDYSLRIMLVV